MYTLAIFTIMEKQFQLLGLNVNEQEVYLAILKASKIAANRVAKLTKINRTTVYSIARKLEGLGLISVDLGGRGHYFMAESREKLVASVEKEERELYIKKEAAKQLSKELSRITSEKYYSVPKIRFVEEGDLESYLYDAYPRWAESVLTHGNVWRGFQDDSLTEHYEKWIEWTWTKDVQKSLRVEFFLNESHIEKKLHEKHPAREMKQLPTGVSFDSSFWITGEYLIMIQTRVRPHYLVEIHDSVMARNQKELFKALWSSV